MSTLSQLREISLKRAESWKNFQVEKFPDPNMLHESAILGSYSFCLQTSKIRLLKKNKLIDLGEGIKEPPSTVARDYLKMTYAHSPKITHNQAQVITNGLQPYPLFSKPGTFEHGFYIDIKSTFWSILNIVGWNLDYYPELWLSAGRAPSDFPFPDHKETRSCLVSVCRPGSILFYNPKGTNQKEKFPLKKIGSPIVNLSISKLISDVLNSIALEAVELGALYANTDGYIVPNERKAANVCQMILDWGLEPRIKAEGRGRVKDIGAYKVGDKKSIPYHVATDHAVEKINAPRGKKWLQERFAFWSSNRQNA